MLGHLPGGLPCCFDFMSRLEWFASEDGKGYQVPQQSAEEAAEWLTSATLQLAASAWLLATRPELSAEGLSEARKELLTAPEPSCASFGGLFERWERAAGRTASRLEAVKRRHHLHRRQRRAAEKHLSIVSVAMRASCGASGGLLWLPKWRLEASEGRRLPPPVPSGSESFAFGQVPAGRGPRF